MEIERCQLGIWERFHSRERLERDVKERQPAQVCAFEDLGPHPFVYAENCEFFNIVSDILLDFLSANGNVGDPG